MRYVKDFDFFGDDIRQIPCLTGKGAPASVLAVEVGILYLDTDEGKLYKCPEVGVWKAEADGSTIAEDSKKLGGKDASEYALKTSLDGKLGKTEQAADSAKLGGTDAASYALKTDTAPNAEKLGGKPPEYYLTPVNLLDNSWFGGRYVNGVKEGLVCQAGLNGLHGTTKYPMDRWISWNADVAFADGYITPGSPIVQRVDLNRIDASKTYTAAICLDDGTIKYASGTPSSDFGSYGLGVYASAISGSTWVIGVNAGINVCWAALYEGKYTAETLPPYVPKQYTVELAECQRYYRRVEHTSNMVLFPAIAYNTKSLYGTLPFGFRVKPTIRVSNVVFCKTGITTAKAVVSIASTATSGGITPIMLTANDGDATTGDTYNIWTSTNGGYMELSADL